MGEQVTQQIKNKNLIFEVAVDMVFDGVSLGFGLLQAKRN